MTRVAVLADIHGNVPALEAVLADLDRQTVDEVLIGGDLVGRGPQGSRIVRRIAALGHRGVRGNHEDYLLAFRRGEVPDEWLEREEWAASRWMAAELGDAAAGYIDELPDEIGSKVVPQIRLVHGSPSSNTDGLGAWTRDPELAGHLDRIDGTVLVCGHTHRPMIRHLPNGVVVNVGAVGLPFNRDCRAQYAILHAGPAAVEIELRQVTYDLEQTLSSYRSSGFLAEGGVTAQLLELELRQATPFLVPFLKWASTTGVPAESGQLESFLEFFDPGESIREFIRRLEAARP